MKIKLVASILFLWSFLIIRCGNNEAEEGGTPLTILPQISEIIFGETWRSTDSSVTNTGTDFNFGITTIYYEIKFNTVTENSFMIRKAWERNNDTLFKSAFMIPSGKKRICGEFRRHDLLPLAIGGYRLSVFYIRRDSSDYDTASYEAGVHRVFDIE